MSTETALIVAAGLAAYVVLRKQATQTAAAKTAAAKKRGTAVGVGSSVADALGKWAGSSSGQANLGRLASSIGGWFSPSTAATPAMDWGVGAGWGDDSTAGAVIDPADFAAMDYTES